MKIALVDDDKEALDSLCTYITDLISTGAELNRFFSAEEFLSHWQPGAYDLIILDIFMDNLTGMDAAQKIRETDKSVKIVFGTSSNEYASESYEVNACYYLRKPFREVNVKSMLDRLDLEKMELSRTARLPDGQSVILRNIIYADFDAHRVTIHNKSTNDTVLRISFAEIEPVLCAHPYFFSPSKGVIVNFYEVADQQNNLFLMTDGTRIPISRRKAKETSDAYAAFRFNALRKGGAH